MTTIHPVPAPSRLQRLRQRLLDRRKIRRLRRRLRHPGLWALIAGTAVPCSSAASRAAGLHRPESIRFSASGKRVIVSNSDAASITVYDLDTRRRDRPRLRLVDRYVDEARLRYAHGASFACADSIYLVLGEYANTLSAISAAGPEHAAASRVLWSLEGVDHGLDHPADLALHPHRRYLVVANREASGLCFFRLPADLGSTPPQLVHRRTVAELNGEQTAAPHGVAFSPDGRFLFVSHKRFFKASGDTGHSALTVYRADTEDFDGQGWHPVAVQDHGRAALHHVACHPGGALLAVTDSRGPVKLLSWDARAHALAETGAIDIFRQGEGVKGVCFTPDGRHLAVTSEFDEVLFFRLDRHLRSRGPLATP